MGIEIAISVAREETRVAVLDGGVVTDLFGDRAKHKLVGTGRLQGAAGMRRSVGKNCIHTVSDLSEEAEPGDTP
jgi:ribonuclease G